VTRPSHRAGWIATIGAVAALVALFFLSCEKRSIEIPSGYQGEAARNPYLAAQRLLERMGTPVRSFAELPGIHELPPPDATLLVPTPRRTLGKARALELTRWVESGGHLVVVSWQLFDDADRAPDLVLDSLGVRQYLNEAQDEEPPDEEPAPPESEEPAPLVTQASTPDEEDAEPAPEIARAEFPDRESALQVEFDPAFRIELDPAATDARVFEIADANGAHLVTLRKGRGLVTALTDDYFLTQPVIEDWDHAELVYRIAHFAGRAGPVWIVWGDEYPGALTLLWRHAWMVVASALLVLALWLWSASRRYGPLAPDPSSERRELMEHVRASGRFQWRRAAAPALLAATRDALLERVRERHPSFASLSPAEQAARLAGLSGLPSERVLRALAFRTDTEAGRFARNIATLEKIRRSL
jgi:hypothetical protein